MSAEYSIAGDWGSSRMRLFRIVAGEVVARADGPGIAMLSGSGEGAPARALLNAIAGWRMHGEPSHIVLCGMAGARAGLADAPYAECPADPAAWAARAKQLNVDGIPVVIAAGLACEHSDGAPDVMRGEETQLFGALAMAPALAEGAHLFALPGTHGKWARVDAGRVLGFQTFPSGELFALLRDHSSLVRAGNDPSGEDEGFDDGLHAAGTRAGLLSQLFRARSAQLRSGKSHGWALGYLSGLLIGCEVREALQDLPTPVAVTLVGDPALVARYARALSRHGAIITTMDGDTCALAGLRLFEETLS